MMCFTILMILLFSTFRIKRLGNDIYDEQSSRKEFVSYILLIFHLDKSGIYTNDGHRQNI